MNEIQQSVGVTIAQAIIKEATKLPDSLLGWDGDGSRETVMDNLKSYLHRVTGWKLLSVEIVGDKLMISEPNSSLLQYNLRTGCEVYGRVRHFGLTSQMLLELAAIL